jgi:hypothetical protein
MLAKNIHEDPKKYLYVESVTGINRSWDDLPGVQFQFLDNLWPEGVPRGGAIINTKDVEALMWKLGNFMMENGSREDIKRLYHSIGRKLLEEV